MDLFFSEKLEIYPRETLRPDDVFDWPEAKKYQYYKFCTEHQDKRKSILEALDVVHQRPDINCISIQVDHLVNSSIGFRLANVLATNDRHWSVIVHFSDDDIHTLQASQATVLRAFSALYPVRLLAFAVSYIDPRRTWLLLKLLDDLPRFKNLDCFNLYSWPITSSETIEKLLGYPFSSQLQGIAINRLDKEGLKTISTTGIVPGRIHTVCKEFEHFQYERDVSPVLDAFTRFSALKTLNLNVSDAERAEHLASLKFIYQWLGSPACPVTNLVLTIGFEGQLSMFLDHLPNIPCLKKIWLKYIDWWSDTYYPECSEGFLNALLQNPSVETVYLMQRLPLSDTVSKRILDFQLACRPRLFVFQLTTSSDYDGVLIGEEKIHHVSLVHQTLLRFRHSQYSPSFPLSAWALVLEKLGSAFDCPSTVVHAVGVDARFHVLRKLLAEPHRMFDPTAAAVLVNRAAGVENLKRTRRSSRNRNKTPRYR